MRDRASAGTAEAPAQSALGAYRQALSGKRNERWCTFQLTLKTITPLMGGGAVAGVPDLLVPLRPRAIKNGIAHWWWLRHRAELKNPDDLWAAYARTFGAASGQPEGQTGSALRIAKVDVVPTTVRVGYCFPYKVGTSVNPESRGRQATMGYALFSARGSTGGVPTPQHRESLRMWVASRVGDALLVPPSAASRGVRTPELTDAVAAAIDQVCKTTTERGEQSRSAKPSWLLEAGLTATITIAVKRDLLDDPIAWPRLQCALKLWSGIGGFGARTSRGLGAFTATAVGACPFAVPKTKDEFAALFKTDDSKPLPGWRALRNGKGHSDDEPQRKYFRDATSAWLDGVDSLRQFRQARPSPLDDNRPGRSYWPDADVVRQLQGAGFGHKVVHPAAMVDANGRSRMWLTKLFLGAPVVLSYKPDDKDPATATVTLARQRGEKAFALNRYPSPIRIRPVAIEGTGRTSEWHSMICFLPFKSDVVGMSASVSWHGLETPRILPAAHWRPPFKTTHDTAATSPALEACMSTTALKALYGTRSEHDPAAVQLGGSVSENWTVVEMLDSFLQAGPGYTRLS